MKRIISKERRELACGPTRDEAIAAFPGYDEERHECTQTGGAGLWQVFNRKRAPINRTITRAISRETSELFGLDQIPLVVTLLPNDRIQFRLKGKKKKTVASIKWLWNRAQVADGFKAAQDAQREKQKAKRKR